MPSYAATNTNSTYTTTSPEAYTTTETGTTIPIVTKKRLSPFSILTIVLCLVIAVTLIAILIKKARTK